jgi:hypothetical protein
MQVSKGTSPSRGRASLGGAVLPGAGGGGWDGGGGGSVMAPNVGAHKLGDDALGVMEELVDEAADELVTTRLALRNMVIHM